MSYSSCSSSHLSLPTHAASITGPAKITDGDTKEILGMAIRLEGLDAPESGQTCNMSTAPLHLPDNNEEVTRRK